MAELIEITYLLIYRYSSSIPPLFLFHQNKWKGFDRLDSQQKGRFYFCVRGPPPVGM